MKKLKRLLKDVYFIATNEAVMAIVSTVIAVMAIVICVKIFHFNP